MSEIIQMPIKARKVLEQYSPCIIKTAFTISWTELAMHRTDNEAIAVAREMAKRDLVAKAIYAVGKDHVISMMEQDMEGLHLHLKTVFFAQDKFEEMIKAVYTQGLLEGRNNVT